MNFNEINDAEKAAAQAAASKNGEKRGRKRKNSIISNEDSPSEGAKVKPSKGRKQVLADNRDGELRTGRWSNEEMVYCDKLIYCFKEGILPVEEGLKLNDFLSSLLKSKQSRLTKKMKVSKFWSQSIGRGGQPIN